MNTIITKEMVKWSFIILIFVCTIGFFAWNKYLDMHYYVGTGSLHAEKISKIAIQKKDPSECNKIRTPIFSIFSTPVTDVIGECYFLTIQALNRQDQ